MKQFSLVRQVSEACQRAGVEARWAGDVAMVGSEGGLSASNFQTGVAAMHVWCRSVERLLVDLAPRELRIHAGFERLSRIKRIEDRYRALASRADALYLYGQPDYTPRIAGAKEVALGEEPLALEWFLVVKARGFGAVVAAEDLDGFGNGRSLSQRRFRGLVTHHPAVVTATIQALDEHLAARSAGPASEVIRRNPALRTG